MPKITRLTPQKQNPRRWSIYIDRKFFAGCTEETLAQLGIREGDDVSLEQLQRLRAQIEHSSIRQRALGI